MNTGKWGPPQDIETLAEGVLSVSTAGHGGIVLSRERNVLVPKAAREADGCYEEDCDWAKAWLPLRKAGVIPDDFDWGGRSAEKMDGFARDSIHRWNPDLANLLTGVDPDPESPILLERKDYAEAREKGWYLAVSAVGSSVSNSVPDGMVGAILAPAHPNQDMPDRSREFFVMVDAELYGDSRLKSGLRIFDESEFARIGFDPFHKIKDEILTQEEAYEIASQWGSYISDGDLGAVFYTFPSGDARPQNSEHRLSLISYTRSCQNIAQERVSEFEAASEGRQADWPWGDPHEDLENLKKLEVFFAMSEQAPEPETPELNDMQGF